MEAVSRLIPLGLVGIWMPSPEPVRESHSFVAARLLQNQVWRQPQAKRAAVAR